MKKLLFLAAVAIAVVSCKKETGIVPVTSEGATTEKLAADLIKKADPALYEKIYNPTLRMAHVGVNIIHGIYVIQSGDISSGTCLSHPTNPCMIIISGLETGTDPEIVPNIPGITYYPQAVNGQVIRNTQNPVTETLTELRTGYVNGNLRVKIIN